MKLHNRNLLCMNRDIGTLLEYSKKTDQNLPTPAHLSESDVELIYFFLSKLFRILYLIILVSDEKNFFFLA